MKGDIKLKRMEIVIRWETGDVCRTYSPRGKSCKSRFRKWIGWWLICTGASALFGKRGWKTYMNRVEGEEDE